MIKSLDSFLVDNEDKEIVVVQGLGFVGAVMSLVVANNPNDRYAVISVDLPSKIGLERINKFNSGSFPIESSDPKVYDYYERAFNKGLIFATAKEEAYEYASTIVVDINLDVEKGMEWGLSSSSYDVKIEGFKKGLEAIASYCNEEVLILIETTVPPGTTQKIALPILIEGLRKRGFSTSKFNLAHSYERVMPGPNYIDSIVNFYRVYSGVDERSELAAESFLKSIISTDEYPLTRLSNTTATEMAKVLENSYRAMNIAFMVEWSRFAEAAGVDLYEVVDAIKMRPTHSNMMKPGIGVGGYCLTKDPLLADWAYRSFFNGQGLEQSIRGVQINDEMPKYAFGFLKDKLLNPRIKNVLMLGVSYRGDVGDTRYSPVEVFYDALVEESLNVKIHDPFVSYWEEKNRKIDYFTQDIESVNFMDFDLVVVATLHRCYRGNETLISKITNNSKIKVFDTVGNFTSNEILHISKTNEIIIIGKG